MFSSKTPLPHDKRKFINFIVALSACLLVIWVYMISQTDTNPQAQNIPSNGQNSGRLDSLKLELGVANTTNTAENHKSKGQSGIFTTLIILSAAVGGLWYWNRKQQPVGEKESQYFTEVARQDLSTGQSILILEFNEEYWFMSSTPSSLELLEKKPKSEVDLKEVHKAESAQKMPFQSMLQNLTTKKS